MKSLTLKGFKSFAQSTTFAFEPGVTCVVGPNGSGKSNVVDALAWVMGEQGVKTLRGGKMEDVIFAGTSTRGPLGRAAVILTIDNSDGALPIDYSEVTISRTLFRNGASEYAINGRNCRLLDVQELLSDSGLGREMHVIVGQGQLDAVLRASPEERRGFIEEAAGILKHRRRKEKTLRKLEGMQTNLTRLSDLAGEIRRQLKPLGRQAEIAREAQSIAAVLRDARARLLADEVVTLRTALDRHGRTESERHSERLVLQEQLSHTEQRVQRLEAAQVGDEVDRARRTSFGLESAQERLRGLFTLANQRLALLGSQSESTHTGPSVTSADVESAEADTARLRDKIEAADAAWDAARAASAGARGRLDAANDEVAAQAVLVSGHDLEISKLTGRSEAAASRLAAVRGEVLRQQNARNAAAERRVQAEALLAETEAAQDPAAEGGTTDGGDVAGASADGPAHAERFELAQAAVRATQAEVERLRDELHTHERERDTQEARRGAFSLALDQKDGSSALVRARLAGIRGGVAEHVRVLPGFEAAIAASLGSLTDAVLADDRASAYDAIVRATTDDLGRVALVVAGPAGGSENAPIIEQLPPGVVQASSVVDAPWGVLRLLENRLIADDLETAHTVSLETGATVITKAGEVLSAWVLQGGTGAARSTLELVAERDTAAEKLTAVTSLVEKTRFDLAEQRTLLTAFQDQTAAARTALRAHEAEQTRQVDRVNRATVQVEASRADLERLQKALDLATNAVVEVETTAAAAAADLAAARSRARPLLDVTARDAVNQELESLRETEVEARLRVDTARERVRSSESRARSLARQLEADQAAADKAARLAVIRRRQIDAASGVAEQLPAVLAAVERSLSEARRCLTAAEAERTSQSAELQKLRQGESALRDRLQAVTENVHGLELQIYEKKLQLTGLLERAGSELGLVETVLVAEYGPAELIPPDPTAGGDGEAAAMPFEREQQQRRFIAAERKLAQLGRVNPLALEEFAALEQRHKFLTEQLTDLTNTRTDLLTIIEEIDGKMQTIFADAFDDTRAAFAEVFPVLFPGGSGSIWLTDPDALLTTGIEVSVKPAGKKIERLSLLSGGERSLAAVALLIAIFKARPSPFYIMDEVEAALDDANLGRLLTIFEDLRESSQLIVITHQKRTMEIADALYGVSMRQDGVSAVVGQRVGRETVAVV
nr:chromosome segregation protein SMC [Cryobacterium roopkundense]